MIVKGELGYFLRVQKNAERLLAGVNAPILCSWI